MNKKCDCTFHSGDRALLVHVKDDGSTVLVPVSVVRPIHRVVLKVHGPKELIDPWTDQRRTELYCYVVQSDRGGTLHVAPGALRPDTALDRIAIAIGGGTSIEEKSLDEIRTLSWPLQSLRTGEVNALFSRPVVGQPMIPPH